jgi:hypothetical protein
MRTYISIVLGITGVALFSLLIIFALINLFLDCQTWDQSLWTEASSCVTPFQLVGIK